MAEDAAAFGPITNLNELRAWLDSVKDRRVHTSFAARNALRCLPAALSEIDVKKADYRGVDLTVTVLRASLTSGVAGTWPTPEVSEDLREAAASAARSADTAAFSAARSAGSALSADTAALSADFAARSAAFSAADSSESAALSADSADRSADSADRSALSSAGSIARSYSAAYLDGEQLQNAEPLRLFTTPLWPKGILVPEWRPTWADFQSRSQKDSNWVFWVKWYRSMLNGQPLDWELQRRIALEITDNEWDEGPGTVAKRIAEIELAYNAERAAQNTELPEDSFRNEDATHGPKNITPEELESGLVDRIVAQPEAIRVSMAALSETVSMRLDLFQRLARPNEKVPIFETLAELSSTAVAITDLTYSAGTSDKAKAQLETEIGRLRAEAEQLRSQLKEALAEIEELKKKPWFRAASVVVTASAIGAVVGGLWVLSGDDKRLGERWENLAEDYQFLQNKLFPDGEAIPVEELRFELPESHEA